MKYKTLMLLQRARRGACAEASESKGAMTTDHTSDMLASNTTPVSIHATYDNTGVLRQRPILRGESVILSSGTMASGRWRAQTTDAATIRSLAPLAPATRATTRDGTIAMRRDVRFRAHLGSVISTKPSMTNCPARVPVMVEL